MKLYTDEDADGCRDADNVPSEPVGYLASQRVLDNQPCPKCGGDRLRSDFVDPTRCHVPRADDVPSDRVRAYAEAIYDAIMGRADDGEDEHVAVARAVMAVADQEQAALRAEVERLRALVQQAIDGLAALRGPEPTEEPS